MNKKEHILRQTLRLLNGKYPLGLYEWLYKYRRDEYDEIFNLVDEIDHIYKVGSVDEFKAILREYWTCHMQAIRDFEEADQLDFNVNDARQELDEERLPA